MFTDLLFTKDALCKGFATPPMQSNVGAERRSLAFSPERSELPETVLNAAQDVDGEFSVAAGNFGGRHG